MIRKVVEGDFDWQDLEKMYGSDFDSKGHLKTATTLAHPPSREDLHSHLLSIGWKHTDQLAGVSTYTSPHNVSDQIGVYHDGKWQRFDKGALIASGTGKDDVIRHFRQSGGR
jgi:hypothetical protein